MRFSKTLAILFSCLILLAGTGWTAADQGGLDSEAGITLDFQNVDLVDLIKTISELTGINFVYDEQVKGKVTIISPRPMSVDDAYNLFRTVLNIKGFTIVPSGAVNKIVPVRGAKEENLPIEGGSFGEQYVTRLIPLKNVDATELANTVLRPLVPKTSHVVAYEPTNTLIISDSSANTERLYQIVQELDVAGSEADNIEIVELKYADAEETAEVANQILGSAITTRTARRTAKGAKVPTVSKDEQIIPYARTNRLILVGNQDFIDKIKDFIARIDQKADQARAGIHVYYLENAEAEILAETLNQILTGMKANQKAVPKAPTNVANQEETIGTVTITADKPTNSLIVNATPKDYETIRGIIAKLDIKRNQVYVEALILELGMDALLDLGVSLQGAADVGSDSVTFGTSNLNTGPVGLDSLAPPAGSDSSVPSLLTQTVQGLILGGLFNPITTTDSDGNEITMPALSVLINLSETDTDINVLSAPRLLTSDNEEAEIVVGSNVPIITSRGSDNAGNAVNSIERQDVALTLRFTPQVTEGDLVRLKVYQEISDVALANDNVGDPNEVGPSIDKRLVKNTVLAEDGRTVVLGGLFQTNRQERISKTPILGDLPLLGWLFRTKKQEERKTSLMVFITPTIIRSPEDLERVTQQNRRNLKLFKDTNGSREVFGPLAEDVAPDSFLTEEEQGEGED